MAMERLGSRVGGRVCAVMGALLIGSMAGGTAAAGPYIAAGFGVAFQADSDITVRSSPSPIWPSGFANAETTYKTGWVVDGALGWAISDFRVEINGSYSDNGHDKFHFGVIESPAPGGIQIVGGMANAYWDVPLHDRFKPYLGGGIGMAYMTFENNTSRLGSGYYVDDNDTELAGNVMAGLGYAITDHVVLSFGYRFYMARDGTFRTKPLPQFPLSQLKVSIQRHDLTLGVRYGF